MEETRTFSREDLFKIEVLKFFINGGLSLKVLEDTMKLINAVPGSNANYPTGKKQILRWLYRIAPNDVCKAYFFIKCGTCNEYIEKDFADEEKPECQKCQFTITLTEQNFFILFDIRSQLIDSINQNWKHLNFWRTEKNQKILSDFHDGLYYKRVKDEMANDRLPFALSLNTDGAKLFNSNFKSLWPIQLVQHPLHPSLRFKKKNIILAGIHFGDKKPDFDVYMYPLMQQMNTFIDEPIKIKKSGESHCFEPFVAICIADLPAKAAVQKIKQFNGTNACGFCHNPGASVPTNKKSVVRYTNGKFNMRNHEEAFENMMEAESSGNIVNGFKGMNKVLIDITFAVKIKKNIS